MHNNTERDPLRDEKLRDWGDKEHNVWPLTVMSGCSSAVEALERPWGGPEMLCRGTPLREGTAAFLRLC